MANKIRKYIVKFVCQSLITFKDNFERGEEIFQHLFYNRTNDRNQLKSSLELSKSMTIVGNPGEGKTCLMHYMFIQTRSEDKFFPIILDYRYCVPRKKETFIIIFVEQMKRYFNAIDHPLHAISEQTTSNNLDTHHRLVMDHLRKIKIEQIQKTKKVIIFLDDLDYYEGDYISLLREYFLPFALNPKTVLILSGRKPLINSISEDNELRHAFNLNPRKIFLVRVDLQTLFESRLSAIFPEKEEKTYFKLFNAFRIPDEISNILRKAALNYLRREVAIDDVHEDSLKIVFGFNDVFWTHLADVTGRNLRQIESILPDICNFHWTHSQDELNFNTDFASSYILSMYRDNLYLLDLVSIKTNSERKKWNGNSVYQIVLEYFYSNSVVDTSFYETIQNFGIGPEQADEAIRVLSHAPYALFDPEYVYYDDQVFKQYKLNRKGKFYLDYILVNPLYYEKLTDRYRQRHEDFGELPTDSIMNRSNRSLRNPRKGM